jgi:hypothetical protein
MVFRYQDRWKMSGLTYYMSWKQVEFDTSFTRFPAPDNYPLAVHPVAQTDDE